VPVSGRPTLIYAYAHLAVAAEISAVLLTVSPG